MAASTPSPLGRLYQAVRRFLERELWHKDVARMPTFAALLTRGVRVLVLSVRGFWRDQCTHKAAALTYITIFSLVPVLAFGFAVAKGFGGFEDSSLDSWLDSTVGPTYSTVTAETGEATQVENPLRNAADQVLALVQSTNANVLGVMGLLLLVYSVVKMLGAVEANLNEIWGVKRRRSLVRRFTDYFSIAFVAPLLLITATALRAYVSREDSWGSSVLIVSVVGPIVPLVTPWLGMAFVLGTLPNTRVRFKSALIGGIVAGSLWQLVQLFYFEGQAALTRYDAIYGSFAALPLFLLWIYLSWTSLLAGAEAGYAHASEPSVTRLRKTGRVDQRYREALAPRLAARVARAFLDGHAPPSSADLAVEVNVAPRVTLEVLEQLVLAGLLLRVPDRREEDAFLPARDPATITLAELLRGMRHDPDADEPPPGTSLDEEVRRALDTLERSLDEAPCNLTLADLARTENGLAPAKSDDPEPEAGAPRASEAVGK